MQPVHVWIPCSRRISKEDISCIDPFSIGREWHKRSYYVAELLLIIVLACFVTSNILFHIESGFKTSCSSQWRDSPVYTNMFVCCLRPFQTFWPIYCRDVNSCRWNANTCNLCSTLTVVAGSVLDNHNEFICFEGPTRKARKPHI